MLKAILRFLTLFPRSLTRAPVLTPVIGLRADAQNLRGSISRSRATRLAPDRRFAVTVLVIGSELTDVSRGWLEVRRTWCVGSMRKELITVRGIYAAVENVPEHEHRGLGR